MPGQASNPKQVSSLGESPAEARRRMASGGRNDERVPQGRGKFVPTLTPQHMAEIRESQEGFAGGPAGGTTEDVDEPLDSHPSPTKAMEMIRQLGQEKMQFLTERNAALSLVERYKAKYGELD